MSFWESTLPTCTCKEKRIVVVVLFERKKRHFISVYMYECLPICIDVHHVCVCCPWRPEEGVASPGTGVPDVC